MICSNCKREVTAQKTIIRDSQIINGCDYCISESKQQSNELHAAHNRSAQRVEYRKDILQKWDSRNYARAYPEQSKDLFGEENARRFS